MTNQIQLFDNANLVSVRDGKCFCTSLMIAEKFEKEHYNVLQSIQNLTASLDEKFTALNFQGTSTEVAQPNGGVRSIPMYNLTRDGFSLLVMGFTGEKALQWKIKFIEAFNAMETQLHNSMPNFNDPLEAAKAWIKAEESRRAAEALAKEKQLALTQEQAAHALTKQELAETREINTELLVRLGLAETYQTVKSMQIWHKIVLPTLPTGKEGNQKFWIPLGRELVKLCKMQGGAYLPYDRRPATYGEFKLRKEWDIIRIADSEWGQINTYPTCARELFIKRLACGYYDNKDFSQYFVEGWHEILKSVGD